MGVQCQTGLLNAPAIEVVTEPGDVLYVPTWWVHHLIGLTDDTLQINIRSGMGIKGVEHILSCLADTPSTKSTEQHTAVHQLADAAAPFAMPAFLVAFALVFLCRRRRRHTTRNL